MTKRNKKRIEYLGAKVNKQPESKRINYEELIDNRRDEVDEILYEKSKNFKKHNLMIKADDIKKDKQVIRNKSYKTLRSGLMTANNKDKYIKANKEHIKSLPLNQQRNLLKLILEHI